MIALLIIFGFVAVGSSIWLVALTSPIGFEDAAGFHFGIAQKSSHKVGKKTGVASRSVSKSTLVKKRDRKKTSAISQIAPKRPTPSPYSDQMKFPFPVTH